METISNKLIVAFSGLIMVLIVISCSKKKEFKFGFLNEISEHRISVVPLKTYLKFDDLVAQIEKLSCQDSIPTFKIETNNAKKLVAFHNPCWEEFGCILIKRRNKLKIINDSIRINRNIALDSIDEFMKMHYINEVNSYLFSENPKKAMVSIEYRNHGLKNLESTLDKITDAYSKLELEIPLVLMLERPIHPAPPNFVK